MAYTPTDWHCGDTIDANKLNNIESGIQEALGKSGVKSVNGMTGNVTLTIPTKTSDLDNDGVGGTNGFVTVIDVNDMLMMPTFFACDAISQAVLSQALVVDADIKIPSDFTNTLFLLSTLEPRTWFCWMNGAEMEFARLDVSVNTSNNAITLYLRGRTSIATGIMGVDTSWTITPL